MDQRIFKIEARPGWLKEVVFDVYEKVSDKWVLRSDCLFSRESAEELIRELGKIPLEYRV